jgi:hypothetical protein
VIYFFGFYLFDVTFICWYVIVSGFCMLSWLISFCICVIMQLKDLVGVLWLMELPLLWSTLLPTFLRKLPILLILRYFFFFRIIAILLDEWIFPHERMREKLWSTSVLCNTNTLEWIVSDTRRRLPDTCDYIESLPFFLELLSMSVSVLCWYMN